MTTIQTTAETALFALSAALIALMTVRAVRFVMSYICREPSPKVFKRHAFWLLGYALATMNIAVLLFSMGVFPGYWTLVLLLYSAIALVFEVSARKTCDRLAAKEGKEAERLMEETLKRTARKNFDRIRSDVEQTVDEAAGNAGTTVRKKPFSGTFTVDNPAVNGRSRTIPETEQQKQQGKQ